MTPRHCRAEPPRRRSAAPRLVRDSELRREAPIAGARSGRELSPSEQRHLIEELVAPDAHAGLEAAAAIEMGSLRHVSVLRNTQQRLDIVLARGSVTEIAATAVVLGLFSNVAPGGAARAIDDRIDGAITELSARRMFSGNLGEIFVLPTGRHPVRPDLVVFAGLGPFDQFRPERLEGVAENVIRTLVRSGIDDLATVILSGSSRQGTQEALGESLEHMVRGYVAAWSIRTGGAIFVGSRSANTTRSASRPSDASSIGSPEPRCSIEWPSVSTKSSCRRRRRLPPRRACSPRRPTPRT